MQTNRHKQVGAGTQVIETLTQVGEAADLAKAGLHIGGKMGGYEEGRQGRIGCHLDRAVAAGLPTQPIQQNRLAIKSIKSTQAKIAMATNISNGDTALVKPLH